MTQRDLEQQAVVAIEQSASLLDAQARYLGGLDLGSAPACVADDIFEARRRIVQSRRIAERAMTKMLRRLDPYGDIYNFRPGEPIDLTSGGLMPRSATGFCNYSDPVTVQDVPANTQTVMHNAATVVIDNQKPYDVDTFFADDKIRVKNGDAVAIRVTATIKASDPDNIAAGVIVGLSIGNGPLIFPETIPLNGFNNWVGVSYVTTAYAGATWETNGAELMVQADGPIQINARNFLITRLHKARL